MFQNKSNNIAKRDVFKLFNQTYFELLEFMKAHSNKNQYFNNFYRKNYIMKKTNIKIFIRTWKIVVNDKYGSEIMNNNVGFFLENDFKNELDGSKSLSQEYKLQDCFDYMKTIYYTLDNSITDKFIKYIRDLTILTDVYNKMK